MKHRALILALTAISPFSLFAQNTCPQNAGLGDWSTRPNWNSWGASTGAATHLSGLKEEPVGQPIRVCVSARDRGGRVDGGGARAAWGTWDIEFAEGPVGGS